jgi:hypothetical protein
MGRVIDKMNVITIGQTDQDAGLEVFLRCRIPMDQPSLIVDDEHRVPAEAGHEVHHRDR